MSDTTDALNEILIDAFAKPRRARGDAGEVEEHSLPDLIEAARYLAGKEAVRKSGLGIRFTRLIPDGTINR